MQVCFYASMQAMKMKIPPFDLAFQDLFKEVILIDIPCYFLKAFLRIEKSF